MKSDPATVLSGILQGSVLGPILFVIYINDLPEVVTCGTYLFADDTKISRQITTKESKPGMSSQKKSYMPSLSTHLKTNWMKRGRICQ